MKKLLSICFLFIFGSVAHGFESDFLDNGSGSAYLYPVDSEIVDEIRSHFLEDKYQDWASDLNWQLLDQFYAKRLYMPVWFSGERPGEKAILIRDAILNSYEDGLDPEEYHSEAIRYLWRARRSLSKARLELLLTDAFFRYVREVKAGYFSPMSVDFDWKLPGRRLNVSKELESYLIASDPTSFIAQLPPAHQQYVALKQALASYRLMAKNGGWRKIPHGPVLKPGDQNARIVKVRKRLIAEGLLPTENLTLGFHDVYDDSLEGAVRHFQRINGHKVDGLIGWFTLRSMNISIEQRIAEIKKNMERWRWLPSDLGPNYIAVNMAGYELRMVENNKEVLQMPVVIGRPVRATPTFIDTMEYVEFNPSWKVPPRIAKEKFLPKLQEDPEFINTNRLKVFNGWNKTAKELDPATINWNHYSEDRWFPFKLEQSPGDHNSLGRIKFMFPNQYRIYLHDSPEKELFNRHVRTFSAGCVRVANPYLLAEKILQHEGDWTLEKVEKLVDQGETQKIVLQNKWPIYMLYWTAWVDSDGNVNFRKDVYQRNLNIATGGEPDYRNLVLAENSL